MRFLSYLRSDFINTQQHQHNTHFHNHRKTAIAASLLAALLFGATTPAAKSLVGETTPWLLAALLYLGSGIGLLLISAPLALWRAHRGQPPLFVLPQGLEWLWLAGAALFGGLLAPVLLMFGLANSPAGNAALFLNLEGVFTVLLAWFVFREAVDRRIALGMACIVAGGVLLSVKGEWESASVVPIFLLSAACFSWAIDNNLSRKLSGRSPLFTVIFKSLTAGGTNLAVALSQAGPSLPPTSAAWLGALATGFLGYGVSLLLFMHALRHLGTARTSAYFSIAPFVGALGALLVLHEPLSPWFLLAAGLMAAGVFMHVSEHHEHEHIHQEEEHNHVHAHDEHHRHVHETGGDVEGTHAHAHRHTSLRHSHPHFPDEHHLHAHTKSH